MLVFASGSILRNYVNIAPATFILTMKIGGVRNVSLQYLFTEILINNGVITET